MPKGGNVNAVSGTTTTLQHATSGMLEGLPGDGDSDDAEVRAIADRFCARGLALA